MNTRRDFLAPTYGNAGDNLGPLLTEGGHLKKAFIATNLSGVSGREAGGVADGEAAGGVGGVGGVRA